MNNDEIVSYLEKKLIKNSQSFVTDLVKDSIKDSLKRLILPSIDRDIRSELTEQADKMAIDTFGLNLEHLLLTRPLKGMVVLGFDHGYVNGCKLAVVDKNGKYLDSTVIKPLINGNNQEKYIGRVIEVQAFEETVDQNGNLSLRFPVYKCLRDIDKEVSYE